MHRNARTICPLAAVLCGLLAFASGNAQAFDGNRKGFLLGVGVGAHLSSIDVSNVTADFPGDRDDGGITLELSIGGGISDQLALYFSHLLTIGDDYSTGIFGAGTTFWLRPSGPSLYFEGTVGLGLVISDEHDYNYYNDEYDYRYTDDTADGPALRLALGYQFENRLQIEGGIMSVWAEDDSRDRDTDVDVFSGQFIASYLWY